MIWRCLRESFELEMDIMRFDGNREVALAWRKWHYANRPTVAQHLRRLWRSLRKQL